MKQMESGSHTPQETKAQAAVGSPHAGHRARLRNSGRKNGLDGMEPHQVVELLLTYCVPRRDVNELAHALMDRFGSLSAILDADEEALLEVKGIGPRCTFFLSMLPQLWRLYAMEKAKPEAGMHTARQIAEYLHALYIGETEEKLYLLLFDNAMRLLDCVCVSEGTVNCLQVDMRFILEQVIRKNAACVVLAHNHPRGLSIPSAEDRVMTDDVIALLDVVKVSLLEHFLVTDTCCTPILRRTRGLMRSSPNIVWADEDYWRNFYEEPVPAGADPREESDP